MAPTTRRFFRTYRSAGGRAVSAADAAPPPAPPMVVAEIEPVPEGPMPTHAERIEVLERLVWCLVDDLIAHARKTRDLVNQTDGPDEWIAAHLKEQP